jgi:hypothetical protein
MDFFMEIPFGQLSRVLLSVHQEFSHSNRSREEIRELKLFILEIVLRKDPGFKRIKSHCLKLDMESNPSNLNEEPTNWEEISSMFYLLIDVTRADEFVCSYV